MSSDQKKMELKVKSQSVTILYSEYAEMLRLEKSSCTEEYIQEKYFEYLTERHQNKLVASVPLDFLAFSQQRKKYSKVWLMLREDEKKGKYGEYLATFNPNLLDKRQTIESSEKLKTISSKGLTFDEFSELRKKSEPHWQQFSTKEQRTIYKLSLEFPPEGGVLNQEIYETAITIPEALPPLNLLESAKIANGIVGYFDFKEMLELSVYFETLKEKREAANVSHETLKPKYTDALVSWYCKVSLLRANEILLSSIQVSVDRCMKLGFTAITGQLGWSQEGVVDAKSVHKDKLDYPLVRQIKKKRSWSEIKKDSH